MKDNLHSSNTTSLRSLVAILFIDIIGFTALMQKNEKEATAKLRRFQAELDRITNKHQGQIVNSYGDGALCTFSLPLQAVKCAMELHRTFGFGEKIPVRMGIHSGSVIFENGKIFGDSVNISSRIESMGVEGSILVSKTVRDDIKNQHDLRFHSLGHFEFKNVDEPIEVFALAGAGYVVPNRIELQGKFKAKTLSSKPSIGRRSAIALALVITFALLGSLVVSNNNRRANPGGNLNGNAPNMVEKILNIFSNKSVNEKLQLTVFVTDSKGNVVLENEGRLNIPLGNRALNEIIGANGRTNFPDITADNLGDTILIGLEAEGWEIENSNNVFVFQGEPIRLTIKKDNSLGLIKGVVKSRDGQQFLEKALVRINTDTMVWTDQFGVFKMLLPENMRIQKATDRYQLTVSKEGFETTSQYHSPKSSDAEIRLNKLK